jgi:5-methylcytosine-specific restriction enzyme subunit McrC
VGEGEGEDRALNGPARLLELKEYQPRLIAAGEMVEAVGKTLWRSYGPQVDVQFPSPKTGGQWQLTAQGWVGYIPLSEELGLALRPKVELGNIFRMLEYAYQLKGFRLLDELVGCRSLEEFYERLANVLARRVLDRGRKGYYRTYIPRAERSSHVRGRLDVGRMARAPWEVELPCRFSEHSADIAENQILAWTLFVIARSGLCAGGAQSAVHQAYRGLRGLAALLPYAPEDCNGRSYNRLNDDYQPMHALCRFFLEHTGPSHESGEREMLPFLVDMAGLFELFVAEWLKAHLPPGMVLRAQERVRGERLRFDLDLVLYDAATGAARYVLDTKYKPPTASPADDVPQVVTYALAKGCREAVLVYPAGLSQPLDEKIHDIRVRTLAFSLDGELDEAGEAFMGRLLGS